MFGVMYMDKKLNRLATFVDHLGDKKKKKATEVQLASILITVKGAVWSKICISGIVSFLWEWSFGHCKKFGNVVWRGMTKPF